MSTQLALGGAARLSMRLVRRGAAWLCVAGALFAAVEVASYRRSYPSGASRAQLQELSDTPAVRVLQGTPRALNTDGGFVAWDAGWFLALLVAIWALLVATRLLRAEEDSGRADLVLSRPLSASQLLLLQLAVVGGGVVAFGAAVALTLVAFGLPPGSSILFGTGLAGVGATSAAAAAVAAQLLDVRRRAVAAAAALVALAFGVRMVGSSQDGREGLLLLTPFGWLDRLQPYADDRWVWLLPLLLTPALLTLLAIGERRRRDTGAARWAGADCRRAHVRLLGSATAFGWRTGRDVVLAWALSVGAFGIVVGALVPSVVALLEGDGEYRRTLEEFGIDVSAPVDGYLAAMAVSLALAFALFVPWRVGALRSEESSGRLELLLVRPLVRRRWLSGAVGLVAVSAVLVVLAAAAGVWAGSAATGGDLSLWQAFSPLLATLPVVALALGVSVLSFGALPRLTVVLPAGLAVLGYLLDLVGTVLGLPQRVLDLSPFSWLPQPPSTPLEAVPAMVMVLLGLGSTAAGIALFSRRDLVGD